MDIALPPLRTRKEDIPVLAAHFHRLLGGTGVLPASFLASLALRSFPGNVRELKNAVERAMLLGTLGGGAKPATAAPPAHVPGLEALAPLHLPLKEAREKWTENFEHVYVRAVLKRTRGNVTHAAEIAGVSRRFLQRLAARLDIKASEVGATERDLAGDDE